jgi:hypothetical protein
MPWRRIGGMEVWLHTLNSALEINGQLHAPAALPPVSTGEAAEWARAGKQKPVVQPVAWSLYWLSYSSSVLQRGVAWKLRCTHSEWRKVVSFTLQPLYPQGINWAHGWTQSRSVHGGKECNSCLYGKSNHGEKERIHYTHVNWMQSYKDVMFLGLFNDAVSVAWPT